jgi:hypothetical protein
LTEGKTQSYKGIVRPSGLWQDDATPCFATPKDLL